MLLPGLLLFFILSFRHDYTLRNVYVRPYSFFFFNRVVGRYRVKIRRWKSWEVVAGVLTEYLLRIVNLSRFQCLIMRIFWGEDCTSGI